jgi:anaerobic magnesium-protoporphyrin IX monomethyl ester cyclase
MRVLLVNPPTGRYMRQDRCQAPVDTRSVEPARPPMELAYAAAVLEQKGAACLIRDYPMEGKGWRALQDDLESFKPSWLVISATTPTVAEDLKACAMAKAVDQSIRTIAKGAHFHVFDRELMRQWPALDVAVRGELEGPAGDMVLGKELADVAGITFRMGEEIIRNADRPFITDLDSLPFPARHLMQNRLYCAPDTGRPIAFISSSRGCPYSCVFCAARMVSGSAVRSRSVRSVMDEIRECVGKYAISDFFFAADTFTWDREWVLELCAAIRKEKQRIRWGANSRVDTIDAQMLGEMKGAGCRIIGFGAESASPLILERCGKAISAAQTERTVNLCAAAGIDSFLVFVVGLPWETRDTLAETGRFISATRASFIEVNCAYPIPGTPYYEMGKSEGLFSDGLLGGHDYSRAAVRSYALSAQELDDARKMLLRRFYLRPRYIARRLSAIRSPVSLLNHLRYGLRLARNVR